MNAQQASVLVVAAHPDDEILGVGGRIARHVEEGHLVNILILAEGSTSRQSERDAASDQPQIAALKSAAQSAAKAVGAQAVQFAGFPDNRMDSIELLDVIKVIEGMIAQCKPAIVYTHHGGDLNVDHQIAHAATLTACRPLPGSTVRNVMAFETPSSTEWASPLPQNAFIPTVYAPLSDANRSAKMGALRAYGSEMRPFPHARSYEAVDALGVLRGSQCGHQFAEAFTVLFQLD